jgi:hypothetical protein
MKSKISHSEHQLVLDYHNTSVLYIFLLFALMLGALLIFVLEAHYSFLKSSMILSVALLPMVLILCTITSRKTLILDKKDNSLTFITQKFLIKKIIQDSLQNIERIEVNKASGGLLEFDILTKEKKIMIYNNYNNLTSEPYSHVAQLKEHQKYKHQIEDFLHKDLLPDFKR